MNSGLSVADLHQLERRLHEMRELVEAKLESLLGRSADECRLALKEDVFGPQEEAMLAELDGGFKAEIRQLRKDLVTIEAALRRHNMKTYGVCAVCGRAISSERLFNQPVAAHCETCDPAGPAMATSKVA